MNQSPLNPQDVALEICNKIGAKFDRHLGSGAFKHAFLVTQKSKLLALKIAAVSPDLKSRFERETIALQRCQHDAIAKLHFVALHNVSGHDFWVIGEEFLPNGTLGDRLSKRLLAPAEVRRLGLIMASALSHLHEKKFVHRDIKPANILFRDADEPVLTDFGIVRILGAPSLTQDFLAQGPGTPLYAAPEQLLNEKECIDWRTDQFGLGLVLIECLLGRHAFTPDGATAREAVMAVANRLPLPPKTLAEIEKAGFGCLIKAVSLWPIQRYRRPDQFIEALTGG